jgi:hypothetical protein
MKMTMHIDETLLSRVMRANGLESKTETIAYALNELDRRARLKAFAAKGLGLSKAELGASVAEHYDLAAMRLSEDAVPYRSKPVKKPPHGKRRARR